MLKEGNILCDNSRHKFSVYITWTRTFWVSVSSYIDQSISWKIFLRHAISQFKLFFVHHFGVTLHYYLKRITAKKIFSGLVQGQKFNVSINIPQQLNIVWRVLSHIGLSSCVRSMNGGNDFSKHWSSDCGGITRSSKGQSRAPNIRNFSGSSATPVTVRRSWSEEAAAGSLLWAAAISR